MAGVRWIDDFVPQDQDAKLAAIKAAKERLGEAFFAEEKAPPPTDAELAEAFASIKASADAIAATPADNPIDPVDRRRREVARRCARRGSRRSAARSRRR